MKNISYALIGGGVMGLEHIRYVNKINNATIDMIIEPNKVQRSMCQEHIPNVEFNSLESLNFKDDIDGVIVCTPNHTHFDILRFLFKSNIKNILLEKPAVTKPSDVFKIKKMAQSWGGKIWVGMEYRYMAPISELLKESQKGTIGIPYMMTVREHRNPFLKKVGNWNRFNKNSGGTLVEKCCHFFDLMHLFFQSNPKKVFASGGQDVNHLDEHYDDGKPDIIDNAFVIVDFENGKRAMLDLCMFAEGAKYQEELSLTGDKGRMDARVPAMWAETSKDNPTHGELTINMRYTQKPETRTIKVQEDILKIGAHSGSTWFEHLGFVSMIKNDLEPDVSLEDGLRAVVMGMAAEKSVKTGKEVDLTGIFDNQGNLIQDVSDLTI